MGYTTVGTSFINLCTAVVTWLTTNFIGSAYMFMILMFFFTVIFTLGGKNQ